MAERIVQINPDCKVDAIEEHLTLDNLHTLLTDKYHYVIDCVDGFRIKTALIAYCKRNRIRVITVGGAGGQIDPTCIRVADLSRTEHDALLSKTRQLLRQEYNFSRNLKRRFDIPCVYSLEQPVFPSADGEVGPEKPGNAGGLTCAGGLGSVTAVTSTFGMVAAAHVLKKLAPQA